MAHSKRKPPKSPYKDPDVKAALKQGRGPHDIWLINCPSCGEAGYYNQGSHFTCKHCGHYYYCAADDEEEPEGHYIRLGEEYQLSDWDDQTESGGI